MSILRQSKYDPPMTSIAPAIRFSTVDNANPNANSAPPGRSEFSSSSAYLQQNPSSSYDSRRKTAVSVSFKDDPRRKSSVPADDAEDEAAEAEERARRAAVKERAKARLALDLNRDKNRDGDGAPGRTPKTAEIMAEVDGALNVFRDNMGRLSARGESIENLEARTEDLARSANAFRRSSRRVRKAQQWKEIKMRIILSLVIAVVVGLIIFSIVCAVRSSNHAQKAHVATVVANTTSTGGGKGKLPPPAPVPVPTPKPTPMLVGQEKPGEAGLVGAAGMTDAGAGGVEARGIEWFGWYEEE